MAMKFYDVRASHEWAEFYVNEREPTLTIGLRRFSASFCCLSSYGAFGHYWHSMGSPFKQFVADIEEDYLLSKIGQRVPSCDVILESVRNVIKDTRRIRTVSKEDAREAWNWVDASVDVANGSPDILLQAIYEEESISKLGIEYGDIQSMEWEGDAVQFVRKLWPAFVEALNK